jgi:hypothetical protein
MHKRAEIYLSGCKRGENYFKIIAHPCEKVYKNDRGGR